MKAALEYFDGARDVSKFCLGWDVEANGIDGDVLVEVKGLSGPDLSIELTPNEYDKMQRHRERFVVFVLSNALTTSCRASIFRYHPLEGQAGEGGTWKSCGGEILRIVEMLSARCSVS